MDRLERGMAYRAIAVALGALPVASWGATYTADSGANTNWNDATNWNPGVPAEGEEVTIADTTTANTLTLNDAPHAIGLFTFGDAGGRTTAFTVNGSPNTLTFNAGLTNTQTTTTGTFLTFSVPVVINGDQTWTVGGANAGSVSTDVGVQLSATSNVFTLNGRLTKAGPGQLTIIGRNIGNGDIDVTAGSVKLNAGSSVLLTVGGTGTITVASGATLMVARNSGTLNMTKSVAIQSGGTLQVGGNQAVTSDIASPINWGTGTATLHQQSTTANQITNFTGPWSGSSTVTINANGTATGRAMRLSGDNSAFTGQLTLNTVVELGPGANVTGAGRLRTEASSVIRSSDATPRTIPNVMDIASSNTIGSVGTGNITFTATGSSGAHTGFSTGNAAKTLTILNERTTILATITGGPSVNNITKAGAGILEVGGVNTYNRPTAVTAGTLQVTGSGRLGVPGNTHPVTVGDAGLLDLRVAGISDAGVLNVTSTDDGIPEVNVGAGVNDVVAQFILNGVTMEPGTYGSSTSAAQNPGLANPDEVFSGTGIITVVPEPATAALVGIVAVGLLARRRGRLCRHHPATSFAVHAVALNPGMVRAAIDIIISTPSS